MRRFPAEEDLCANSIFSAVQLECIDEDARCEIEDMGVRNASDAQIADYLLKRKNFRACCSSFEYSFIKEIKRFKSLRQYWTRDLIIGCSMRPEESFIELDSDSVYVEMEASADEIMEMSKRERTDALYDIAQEALRKIGRALGIRFKRMAKMLKQAKPRLGAWKRNHGLRYTDNLLCGSFDPSDGVFSDVSSVELAIRLSEIHKMRRSLSECVKEAERMIGERLNDKEPTEVSFELGGATFRFILVSNDEIGSKVTWNARR